MLLELSLLRAVVRDVYIPARYGDETSHLSILKTLRQFPPALADRGSAAASGSSTSSAISASPRCMRLPGWDWRFGAGCSGRSTGLRRRGTESPRPPAR